MTKQPTLTKADLIEEVLRITELPRKESETIVETIFESIIDAVGNTPAEFTAIIKKETPEWAKVIKDAGIKLGN